jgi:hypothetical protein
VGIFYASEAASTYNFQVSPLTKLQAFTFGRLGIVSPTVFVIVLCLGFALGLGFYSGVEVQKICGKLSWIGDFKIEHHLQRGRPLAAFQSLLFARVHSAGSHVIHLS